MLVTPELKDKILKEFIDAGGVNLQLDIHETAKEYNIDYEVLEIILDDFENLGFFNQMKMLGGNIRISMKVPAFDFYSHGGFVGQEELLKKNIEKLLLEIESLKPSMPDKISTITSIAGNIATALGLILTK
ncbi:MAG: hypothetical protein ACLTWE_01855 [Dysgonomonas mossii]|uniref:hypothetical protein n=1 Tax=Dysgonomonas mossii TaxID=163665 RepID=UPI003994560B